MKENILTKIKVSILPTDGREDILEKLLTPLSDTDYVYSYLIYRLDKERHSGWDAEVLVSQDDNYNTLSVDDVIVQIVKHILTDRTIAEHRYVIGYKQPSLDILCELFDPLMRKLAIKCHKHWPKYEFEDTLQICRCTMCLLYRKGYYVNRRLLERAFYNNFLLSIRKDKNTPVLVSLDGASPFGSYTDNGNEQVNIADVIPDVNLMYEEQDKEDDEEYQQQLQEQIRLVKSVISDRQYDQLLREYGNEMTTNRGRQQIKKIKDKLNKGGLNVTQ